MKRIIFLIINNMYFSFIFAQGDTLKPGRYLFKGDKYYESLDLEKNGTFRYRMDREFLHLLVCGNWQTRQDSLILDSNPQKEKLIVYETKLKQNKKFSIYVSDKFRNAISYCITAITTHGDTITLKEQWQRTTFDTAIKKFYLMDNKGLKSPVYIIKGQRINCCYVLLETERIFENEVWKFGDGKITPVGLEGMEQPFKLVLTSSIQK